MATIVVRQDDGDHSSNNWEKILGIGSQLIGNYLDKQRQEKDNANKNDLYREIMSLWFGDEFSNPAQNAAQNSEQNAGTPNLNGGANEPSFNLDNLNLKTPWGSFFNPMSGESTYTGADGGVYGSNGLPAAGAATPLDSMGNISGGIDPQQNNDLLNGNLGVEAMLGRMNPMSTNGAGSDTQGASVGGGAKAQSNRGTGVGAGQRQRPSLGGLIPLLMSDKYKNIPIEDVLRFASPLLAQMQQEYDAQKKAEMRSALAQMVGQGNGIYDPDFGNTLAQAAAMGSLDKDTLSVLSGLFEKGNTRQYHSEDLGGQKVFTSYNPYLDQLNMLGSAGKSMTPGERASNGLGWARLKSDNYNKDQNRSLDLLKYQDRATQQNIVKFIGMYETAIKEGVKDIMNLHSAPKWGENESAKNQRLGKIEESKKANLNNVNQRFFGKDGKSGIFRQMFGEESPIKPEDLMYMVSN